MPDMPAVGGARTFEQLEALARLRAGEPVDPARLHPADRPQEPAASSTADETEVRE